MKLICYTIERVIFNLKIRWCEYRLEECSKKVARLEREHRKTVDRYKEFLVYNRFTTYKLERILK